MINKLGTTIQGLNSLFQQLESKDSVIYIVNQDYSKQYYLTPNFEHLWEHPVQFLYEDMKNWSHTVVKEDLTRITKDMNEQVDRSELPLNNSSYRIITSTGNIKFVQCKSFPLLDTSGNVLSIVGIVDQISSLEFFDYLNKIKHGIKNFNQNNNFLYDVAKIMEKEFALQCRKSAPFGSKGRSGSIVGKFGDEEISISKREVQCLYYLKKGLTAKETSEVLSLSNRTVEAHLDNVRNKLKCQNKYQVLGKLSESAAFNSLL